MIKLNLNINYYKNLSSKFNSKTIIDLMLNIINNNIIVRLNFIKNFGI